MAPGITPVYANNPAFRLVSFDKETLELSDYTQYNMDITLSNGIVSYFLLFYFIQYILYNPKMVKVQTYCLIYSLKMCIKY